MIDRGVVWATVRQDVGHAPDDVERSRLCVGGPSDSRDSAHGRTSLADARSRRLAADKRPQTHSITGERAQKDRSAALSRPTSYVANRTYVRKNRRDFSSKRGSCPGGISTISA